MNNKVSFKQVLRLAGAFVACAIGSGFATGQEVMQFFTAQGIMSIAGTLVTMVIFAWCGASFMKHGYDKGLAKPDDVLKFYCGEKIGKIASIFIQAFLYSVYVIMVAGAGATLSEFFGLPPMLGRVLIAVFSLITVVFGLSKAADVLGGLGTVIIIFSISIGLISFLKNPGGLSAAAELIPQMELTKTQGGWLWSAILYPGYNAIVVMFLSCCLGEGAGSRKEAILGGTLGGICFGLAILAMDLGLTVNIAEVGLKSVPTLTLAENLSPVFAYIFSVIIFFGIYTTAVPMLWGVVRQFAEDRTKKSAVIALVLTAVGLALGMTDFKKLVNIIYPFSGYVGVALMVIMIIRDLTYRKKNK